VDDTKHIRPEVLAEEQAEMPDELYRQEYYCDFSAANVGAIFGRYIEQAEKEGRIGPLGLGGDDEVWVTSDIGYRDKAAFVWWRRLRGGFEIFHYDDGSGMDAEEWITRLRGQPAAAKLVLPHDARARTFQSKRTVVETFLADPPWPGCGACKRAAQARLDNSGRLSRRIRISNAEAVEPFLMAMRAYAFRYDAETKTFSSEPEHNWASHGADAFMEGASILVDLEPQPQKSKIMIPSIDRTWDLETLFETVGRRHQSGRLCCHLPETQWARLRQGRARTQAVPRRRAPTAWGPEAALAVRGSPTEMATRWE
jgi:hypothetical protein